MYYLLLLSTSNYHLCYNRLTITPSHYARYNQPKMKISKKYQKIWTIIVVVSSLGLIVGSLLPLVLR
jgi:hypothetical protein